MSSILEKIVEQTRGDLLKRRRRITFGDLESFPCYEAERRGFRRSLKDSALSIIAEVKKASPSKGVIRHDFNPLDIAESYIRGGASALSVLTDAPFFQGDVTYMESISKEFDIPLLRKDFIVDPYQIKEARAHGADAVLLIASITSGSQLDELLHAAKELQLDALVECYSRSEAEHLDWDKVDLFGVNNRDLHTFNVDLHRGVELLKISPSTTTRVSESGLSDSSDLQYLVDNGIDAALIGEHFMKQPDPGLALSLMLEELSVETGSDREMEGHH